MGANTYGPCYTEFRIYKIGNWHDSSLFRNINPRIILNRKFPAALKIGIHFQKLIYVQTVRHKPIRGSDILPSFFFAESLTLELVLPYFFLYVIALAPAFP